VCARKVNHRLHDSAIGARANFSGNAKGDLLVLVVRRTFCCLSMRVCAATRAKAIGDLGGGGRLFLRIPGNRLQRP
jgi:hypothetical protein